MESPKSVRTAQSAGLVRRPLPAERQPLGNQVKASPHPRDHIKVDKKRLGDTEKVKTWDGQTVFYSSRVRALLDADYDWARFGTLPRAYRWIRKDLRAVRIDPAALVRCTLRFGDVGTIRRMGVLLENEGVDGRLLERLEKPLKPTSATIPFIPGKPKRGRVNRRWGVVLNT